MKKSTPSLERRLSQFIESEDYVPMKQHELVRAMKIAPDKRRDVRQALKRLEAEGKIARLRQNRWGVPPSENAVIGDLSVHADGFGFVSRPASDAADLFIPARKMGTALHGDRVEVVIDQSGRGRSGRGRRAAGRRPEPEGAPTSGRVVRVVERHFKKIAGILKETPHYKYVIPDHPRIQQNVHVQSIAPEGKKARDGHRVVMELLAWEDPAAPLPGRLIEDLGPADAPGADMLGLLRSHGLEETFPGPIEKAARAIRAGKAEIEDEERRDLRDELIFTIDPEDARDFDDAVSLTRNADNQWVLSVHIADVASYVAPDSPIDREARQRGNSVYLVDRVIQMLPRHLTEEVCSLVPNEDRLAHTVRMTLSPRGKLLETDTFPSLIRSSTRLNYDQVQAHLQGEQIGEISAPVGDRLKEMERLAGILRRKRARSGSILFEMPEVRCVVDEQGVAVDIVPRISFAAYHLIEEFMLMANQAVAHRIARSKRPVIYRIHAPPDEEQWERIGVDLRALGITLPALTREDLNAIAEDVAGQPVSHIVNLAMLRNLQRAVYSAERAEHFGLAFSHYLHFTSPIRRYPDLIVHRVLKAIERGAPPPYSESDIQNIADHCSKTEREAADAEQESVHLKRIEYYAAQLEAGHIGPYRALVTSMTGKGLLVELVDTLQRGIVPFALLRGDHYQINEHRNQATGKRTRHTWHIGDQLDVELVRVDQARKLVDFRPAQAEEAARPNKPSESSKKKRRTKKAGKAGGAKK